jgi:NAD(P)-dependent dehydrogenase (short-subunit alcohol dehydrogenase family)
MPTGSKRTIVITGVSRGLGHALVEELARGRHIVIGCARSEGAILELAAEHPPPHVFSVVDTADGAAVRAWAARVIDSLGAPDILVNNAGLINPSAPLWEVPEETFSRLVDVNIKGVFLVTRAFLPAMIARGSGVVVNMSSGWGRAVDPTVGPYCASKWAIEGMTRALALELPPGLAAVPLNPGVIDTEMLRSCFGTAAGDYPTPEAWAARAAPFLLGLSEKDNGRPLTVP